MPDDLQAGCGQSVLGTFDDGIVNEGHTRRIF
jgi:hypothetical protein